MARPISGVKPQSWNKHFSKWMKRNFWKRHRKASQAMSDREKADAKQRTAGDNPAG